MKIKTGKKTILAMILLLVAGGIYYYQNMDTKSDAPQVTNVVVAKDYIPANTKITEDMVTVAKRYTPDMLKQKDDLTAKLENIVGKRAIAPIYKEEPVNMKRLIDNEMYMDEEDEVKRTFYALPINVTDKALKIKKGSFINIWKKPTENGLMVGEKTERLNDKDYKVYDTISEGYTSTGTETADVKTAKEEAVTTYLLLYLTDDEISELLDINTTLVNLRVVLHGENVEYELIKSKIEQTKEQPKDGAKEETKVEAVDMNVMGGAAPQEQTTETGSPAGEDVNE